MTKMCKMEGCKEHKGMCVHEKMMLVVMAVVVAAVAIKFI